MHVFNEGWVSVWNTLPHTHTHTRTHTHTMCGEWEMSILAWLSLIVFQLFMLSASTLLKGKTSLQLHFNFEEKRE